MIRKPWSLYRTTLILAAGISLGNSLWADEVIDMGTYVPAGGTSGNPFDRLHAKRMTIGETAPLNFSLTNPAEPNPLDGTLLVSQRLGVGTADPQAPIHILGMTDANATLLLERQGSGATDTSRLTLRRSRPGSAPVQMGDTLGVIQFDGYNGTSYPSGVRLVAFADANWSTATAPASLRFFVAPPNNAGGGATTEAMRISSAGNVGIGTAPVASAILDVNSTNRGFLMPRLTTAQRDAVPSPAAGLLIYNSDTNRYNTFDGSVWRSFGPALATTQKLSADTSISKNPAETLLLNFSVVSHGGTAQILAQVGALASDDPSNTPQLEGFLYLDGVKVDSNKQTSTRNGGNAQVSLEYTAILSAGSHTIQLKASKDNNPSFIAKANRTKVTVTEF